MEIPVERHSRTSGDRFLKKYAMRMARLCYLRHHCQRDDPVLATEMQLMDMAHSKLQEALLSRSSVDALGRMRCDLEFEIRQLAREWATSEPMGKEARTSVLELIEGEDLSRLFLLDS